MSIEAPFKLAGDAVYDIGCWFASEKIDAPWIKQYKGALKVYGNRCDWFITPDTARSMASALLYYADKADEYKRAEAAE